MADKAVARVDTRHDTAASKRAEILAAIGVRIAEISDTSGADGRAASERNICEICRRNGRIQDAGGTWAIRGTKASRDHARVRSDIASNGANAGIATCVGQGRARVRFRTSLVGSVAAHSKQSDQRAKGDGCTHSAKRSRWALRSESPEHGPRVETQSR